MSQWQRDLINLVQASNNETELLQAIMPLVKELGFEYCAYGIHIPIPISKPRVELVNNYTSDWKESYHQNNYLSIDPTVAYCWSNPIPLVWSEDLYASARNMWEDARAHGLEYGWAQSSHSGNGMSGMLTLSRGCESLGETELENIGYKLSVLTHSLHTKMSDIFEHKHLSDLNANLTNREKSILRWTAEGKTAGEISLILNITERTVNFHITNINKKLNSPNKICSAVRAALLGLI